LILLLEIAREAAARGIGRFQLGSGGDHYKRSLASGETSVGAGSVDCVPFVRLARRGWNWARRAAHSSALAPLTRGPLALVRPLRERFSLR
jgi:CelD/BcsL family acetyltransferase involved in cellulose biosynthesis